MAPRRKNRSYKYLIRRAHRYLGVVIGVQLLLWTIGGLYFSWSDIDEIHGDHLIKHQAVISTDISLAPLSNILNKIKKENRVDSIIGIKLINILQKPTYQIRYFSGNTERVRLADAQSGNLRDPISKGEAIILADSYFLPEADVDEVIYLESTGSHHEYREKPLPAWAVSYDYPGNPVIYIAANEGTYQNIRHRNWRSFDFLWMLHTMDYKDRDHFGNILLRSFSLLAVVTVISGYVLFLTSMKRKSNMNKQKIKESYDYKTDR